MLNNHGVGLWFDRYNISVRQTDESNQYPFARYASLMNALYGTILIRDLCFRTRDVILLCKEACGENQDDDEFYFVFSQLQEKLGALCNLVFHEVSLCAGILEIRKKS